ncbi:MAG: M1 family aminopeptidase [Gammaproteobacteria bacterium]|nr:M1 family aminopeptidase [Gammaproteobacteria bacterium]
MNKSLSRFVALLLVALTNSLAAQAAYAVDSHDITLSLKPDDGAIEIDDRIVVSGRDRFVFELAPWLEIESLSLDGAAPKLHRQGSSHVIELADSGRHELHFELKGIVPARTEDRGASTTAYSSSGSDGAYLPAYSAWIPQDLSTAIVYRLKLRVPIEQRAVASGKLIAESIDAGFYQARFETKQAGEPPSVFAGPYQVRERQHGDLRLRTYFHSELAELSDVYLDAAVSYIRRYHESIGDYPYADFHIISAPLPVGLGFPNLTYVGRRVIPLPFMRGRSLAHEVLHNWWGNGIAVDYANGNWAEGLTTYMADYALERDKGPAAARSMRIKWLRDYAALPAERDQPVRAFRSKRHQAAQVIGYNKVAFIFHMLSLEIGEDAFIAGLRRFWQQNRYQTAGWLELQGAFENSAGRDLGWFFRQWLDRRGAPRLSLGTHSVEQVDDGFRISVDILQPVSGYRFKLPLLLQTANGSERHEVSISENLTRLEWRTSAKPEYLHFDPDSDVFRRLQRNETPPILRDVLLDASAITMIGSSDAEFERAGRELAGRLMDVTPRFQRVDLGGEIDHPLLLITSTGDLAARLAKLKLQPPAELSAQGWSAAVWTARLENGNPVLVISADDGAALRSLLRPLPHYGGQSYVLFDAGRAATRGIWPVKRGPLFLDFSGS